MIIACSQPNFYIDFETEKDTSWPNGSFVYVIETNSVYILRSGIFNLIGGNGTQLTPAAFSTQQNDYNPSGIQEATSIILAPTTNVNITGIVAPLLLANSRKVFINASTFNITFRRESASSSAANRIAHSGDLILKKDDAIGFQYDFTNSRWRIVIAS